MYQLKKRLMQFYPFNEQEILQFMIKKFSSKAQFQQKQYLALYNLEGIYHERIIRKT